MKYFHTPFSLNYVLGYFLGCHRFGAVDHAFKVIFPRLPNGYTTATLYYTVLGVFKPKHQYNLTTRYVEDFQRSPNTLHVNYSKFRNSCVASLVSFERSYHFTHCGSKLELMLRGENARIAFVRLFAVN